MIKKSVNTNIQIVDMTCFEKTLPKQIPKKLHKKKTWHNYPLLPENRVITYNDLSPKQRKLLIKKIGKNAAKRYRSKKLVSTLLTKKKYKAVKHLQKTLTNHCTINMYQYF